MTSFVEMIMYLLGCGANYKGLSSFHCSTRKFWKM